MSVATDRYREMAKDYFITKDMVVTYAKFHPKLKDKNCIEVGASRILSNINFLRIKEEVAKEIEPNLEAKINECLNVLYNEAHNAKRSNDRTTAASSYLKFTKGETSTIHNVEEQNKSESLVNRILGTYS